MCRLMAYIGPPRLIADVVLCKYSIIIMPYATSMPAPAAWLYCCCVDSALLQLLTHTRSVCPAALAALCICSVQASLQAQLHANQHVMVLLLLLLLLPHRA